MTTRTSAPPFPVVDWLDHRTPRQRRIAMTLGAVVVAVLVLRVGAQALLDRWWFQSVTSAPVWSTGLRAQLALAVVVTAVSGFVLVGSARAALRTKPHEGFGPNRLVRRYRDRMGPAHRWAMLGVAGLLSIRYGIGAMAYWQPWLLFWHGPSLGVPVPDVGGDLGYHIFKLPLLGVASDWLRGVLIVAMGLLVAGLIANGALKLPRRGRKSSAAGLRRLALLVAAFGFVQALDYVFVRIPGNGTNQVGAFDGPGYTQVEVIVPALWVLAATALASAFIAVSTARGGRWKRLVIALCGWAVLQGVLIGLVPVVVQRLVVAPAEGDRELPFIARNLEATRDAYRLDIVQEVTEPFVDGIETLPADSAGALGRIPLFGEDQMVAPLQVLQGTTGTRITDVDLDRYTIDGRLRPVLLAVRNASPSDLPERGWVQLHMVYTHGDGVVAVPADTTAPDGQPDVETLASMTSAVRSQIYFGEGLAGWYAITGTKRAELGSAPFDGTSGIDLGSRARRAVLAAAVGEVEPLVSAELTDDSQLLYRRDIRERLATVAPFLSFDSNAYPVVADGRITWVIDGYTTSSNYPYAQFARNVGLPGSSGLAGRPFNYVHGSVKATVDAYDGTVHLYRTQVGGSHDPILDAWESILPGLVEPIDEMPSSIRAHLLYPQDLFTVQTAMLGRYHVTDPETLFNGTDSWAISASAGAGVARAVDNGEAKPSTPAPAVSLFMPGDGELGDHWVAIRPYGPGSSNNPTSTRDELAALAIADHDNPEHLLLVRMELQPGRLVSSPQVAQSAIDTDRDLAAVFTLLNANGSAVQFGPMTPVPLDGALVWVRPIIVTGTADTTTPRLHGVAAVSKGLVGESESVESAIDAALRSRGT